MSTQTTTLILYHNVQSTRLLGTKILRRIFLRSTSISLVLLRKLLNLAFRYDSLQYSFGFALREVGHVVVLRCDADQPENIKVSHVSTTAEV